MNTQLVGQTQLPKNADAWILIKRKYGAIVTKGSKFDEFFVGIIDFTTQARLWLGYAAELEEQKSIS
jgi:hypothetical protein